MKIERSEHKIVLIPETEFEAEALRLLASRSIEKVRFQDSWNRTGGLEITLNDPNNWDNRR